MREEWSIAETDFVLIGFGSYGDAFGSASLGLVRKVFRKGETEGHVREVFEAEAAAYELAARGGAGHLIPERFQRASAVKVVAADGADRSELYFTDLVLEMAWVRAPLTKWGCLTNAQQERLEPCCEELRKAGVQHLTDASIAWESSGRPTFIDFAVRYIEPPSWEETWP